MPPENKATTWSDKKGKVVKKNVSTMVTSEHASDWTSGEEEPSMKDMFQNLTSLTTWTEEAERRGGWPSIAVRQFLIPPRHLMPPQLPPLSLRHHCCNCPAAIRPD